MEVGGEVGGPEGEMKPYFVEGRFSFSPLKACFPLCCDWEILSGVHSETNARLVNLGSRRAGSLPLPLPLPHFIPELPGVRVWDLAVCVCVLNLSRRRNRSSFGKGRREGGA